MIDLTTTRVFKEFVTGDLSLNEFERWIKTDANLMKQLDKVDYQSLVNFDMGIRDSNIEFELRNLYLGEKYCTKPRGRSDKNYSYRND